MPSLEVRTWRELINCRSQVIAKRTRAKNTVRALLRGAGIVPPKQPGLWTKKGLAWLCQVALPTSSQQLRRDLLLEEIETLRERAVREVRIRFRDEVDASPFRILPGVTDVRLADRTITLRASGDLDQLIKLAARYAVTDLVSAPVELDEVFLDYYRRSDAGS